MCDDGPRTKYQSHILQLQPLASKVSIIYDIKSVKAGASNFKMIFLIAYYTSKIDSIILMTLISDVNRVWTGI